MTCVFHFYTNIYQCVLIASCLLLVFTLMALTSALACMSAHPCCVFLRVSLEIVTMSTRLSFHRLSCGAGISCRFWQLSLRWFMYRITQSVYPCERHGVCVRVFRLMTSGRGAFVRLKSIHWNSLNDMLFQHAVHNPVAVQVDVLCKWRVALS